jgi:flagellar motility protein MotE (MotC chaperone)
MTIGADGHTEPLAAQGGGSLTEQTLLERLGERRAALDKRSAELDMREAVIKAAEKQMQERADALKALEARIAELDSQKKSMEDTQFAALVKMYETMKPQEAAAIFDGLDMGVLQRVAEAMDPRKMSPILAKMSSARAQQLTTALAGADPRAAATTMAATDPGALPQIVGH